MNNELVPPHLQLAIMSRNYVVSRCIHAIAHLGIADHMSDKPTSVEELALLTETVPDLLNRVLNFLTIYGLFTKHDGAYALTPLSAPLREDHPNSVKDILSMVDETWWQAFAHLETELKTGVTAFKLQHHDDFLVYLNTHLDKKNRYQKGINKLSEYDDQAICKGFDFGAFKNIIDIGANLDHLSKTLSANYPSASITLFNFMNQLCENPGANYFSTLNPADAYLFKGILHDFDDNKARDILCQCHKAMRDNSSLVIIEQIVPANNLPHTNKTMDIIMLVLVGGKQRTLDEWCRLVEGCGFKLKNSHPTEGIHTVMEFIKINATDVA